VPLTDDPFTVFPDVLVDVVVAAVSFQQRADDARNRFLVGLTDDLLHRLPEQFGLVVAEDLLGCLVETGKLELLGPLDDAER